MALDINTPNVVLPLASSYNERGVAGYTETVTNAKDQRKINSMYEVATNRATGKSTLYLVKRPGFEQGGDDYGATGQRPYLATIAPGIVSPSGLGFSNYWLFSTSGNDSRASNGTGTTTVIASAAGYAPTFVDKFLISGTENLVVQLWHASNNVQTVWYSTAIGSFTQITDGDFTGLVHRGKMEFMDGYAFVLTSTNKIYNSDLNSIANWTAGQFIVKQIKQDVANGLARLGKQIIAFGYETMEVFQNSGNASGSPLSVVQSLAQNVGLTDRYEGATHYYTTQGNILYFVGATHKLLSSPSRGVFAYNGSVAQKVSTPFIDKILNQANNFCVTSVSIHGKLAIAISLTKTDSATPMWLMYFPEWNDWFEWNSTVVQPCNDMGAFLGVGSSRANKLLRVITTNDWRDSGTDYTWTHQFELPAKGNERHNMPYCGLKGDTPTSAQAISVQFSDDDYQTFDTARTIDMTSKQKALYRNGSWQGQRAVRLSHTGNTEVRLESFLARIK